MTIRFAVPFALFALCCGGPVFAAAGETTPPKAESSDGSEVVCRVMKITGSRLGAKRTCLTRDQWAQQRQDQRESVERAQTQRYYTAPGS